MTQLCPDSFRAAISPNIFDAHSNTDFLLPLVLGNLLSKNLWNFSAKLRNKLGPTATSQGTDGKPNDPIALIRTIQRQLDRQFMHLHPGQVAAVYGELDLVDEKRRLGAQAVENTLQTIEATFRQRIQDGSIPAEALTPLLARIEQNRYPAFYYTNVDLVLANKDLTGHRTSSPMGLTSCLDEVAIFAALAMTMPADEIANVICLTSASHYTAFGWMQSGEPWWLYGKNKLFSRQDWAELVDAQFKGDRQRAFDYFFKDMDHIVSVAGTFDLATGRTSIAEDHASQIIEKLELFFGHRLSQVSNGLARPVTRVAESTLAPTLRRLLGTHSLEATQHELQDSDDPALSQVLYSFRSLDVPYLQPYLDVALQQPNAKALGASLASTQDALEVIRNIQANHSLFKDRNRIAMPDETLRLQTGTDRDKALLLHVLLEHGRAQQSREGRTTTFFTEQDSFVCSQGHCFSLNSLSEAIKPSSGILWRLPDGMSL